MARQKGKRGVKADEPQQSRTSKRIRGERPSPPPTAAEAPGPSRLPVPEVMQPASPPPPNLSPLAEVPIADDAGRRGMPVLTLAPGVILPVAPPAPLAPANEEGVQEEVLDLSGPPLIIDEGGDGDDILREEGEEGNQENIFGQERREDEEAVAEQDAANDDGDDHHDEGEEEEAEQENVQEEEKDDENIDVENVDEEVEDSSIPRKRRPQKGDSTRATASANPRRLVARVAVPGTSASSRQTPVIQAVPVIGSSSRPLRAKGPPPPPKRGRGRPRKNAPLPDDDDDDDDDDGDDSDCDPGSKVLAGRRRFRRRPAGTVALKSTKRIIVENDDPKDLSYEPPAELENDVSEQPVFLFDIRSYKRVCYNVARSLEVLDGEHGPKDEGRQMSAFRTKLAEALNLPLERTLSIETNHAIWYCKILRYKDRGMRLSALMQDEDNFLSDFNCSLSSVAKDFRRLLAQTSKPLLLMVGQASVRNENGHCQLLAIQNTERGLRASIKDCLPRPDAVAKTLAMNLLKELKVARVDLVCELNEEEDVTYTECVKEAYRIVGDCLDGRFFWMRKIPGAFKSYNVNRNVQIKPTPEKLSFFM